MNRLIITEEERSRILGMHNKAAGKQYLMEAAGYVVQTTFKVPYSKDAKGNMVYDGSKRTYFTITNNKGKGVTQLQGYNKVSSFTFAGINIKVLKSQKDSSGQITGELVIPGSDKNAVNFITSVKDKTLPINDERISVVLIKDDGSAEPTTIIPPTFTSYDTGAPTTTTPTQQPVKKP